jgi:hypothetical protein
MPHVIGVKIRVRFAAHRKHGLVAASKHMQTEGMKLGRYRHVRTACYPPPPAAKSIQYPLRKTKPPRHPPAVSAKTPSSYVWLSCFSQLRPGGLFDLDRLVEKWRWSHHPPPPPTRNIVDFPSWTPSHCAFPRPSEPTPRRTLINSHVFEASNQVERSNSSAQSQFNDALNPPRRP